MNDSCTAPKVGFLSKTYLHRLFRQKFGCTPRQFRLKGQSDDRAVASATKAVVDCPSGGFAPKSGVTVERKA